jgi:capsid protein
MNFIEVMLTESLRNRNPQLDLQGADRRVLEIAHEDLMNFLRMHWGLIGNESAEYELIEKLYHYHQEEPKELEDFVNVWTGLWMNKWGERVKLLIGQEDSGAWQKVNKKICDAEPVWKTLPNRREIEDIIVESLIRNGEICGTSILAENLIKMELGSETEKLDVNKDEDVLNLVNGTLRRARGLSRSKGPLIFVRLDKRFFQFSQ